MFGPLQVVKMWKVPFDGSVKTEFLEDYKHEITRLKKKLLPKICLTLLGPYLFLERGIIAATFLCRKKQCKIFKQFAAWAGLTYDISEY